MEFLETEIGEIVIREAEPYDATDTVGFMNWVTGEVDFHTYGANDFKIKPADEIRMIQIFKQKANCIFLVAVFENKIVAVATLSGGIKDRVKHRGTIGITVAKRYWRLGIGLKMMEILIDFCKNNPVLSKLELLVHENNYPAIALYKKLGFFDEGIIKRYFKIDGEYYNGINMGLIVDGE